ncbi:MAG: serine/threonine protein kinase [Chamaesiphon sp.]|nr:serine/threonine protein kinase [Chamaesiphon sp.]
MQPPIPLGTLLQQRYRVTKILGQGGFGRTYLSQDTGCFDEMCVLKEFSPNDRGRDALKKSKELFQREAQVLYQINHPQIPKFRANFEEQKRLFLVQEYAEGKTVARSLSDRLKNNQTFKEAEAVKFLQDMLPVLTHIHGMGIIHRDISPDNIIFRDRDKLPVLIDFGVVKAGVTQLEVSTQIHQGTTVGKAGYAPGEQLQTGEAYANSDLYALAVTVVVMMTGRKPESLIDKSTMTWKWHQWVPTLTPWFAKILNKMLSRVPNSRYQSATEVLQALRSVSDFVGTATEQSGSFIPSTGINRPATGINSSTAVPLSRAGRTTSVTSSSRNSNIQPPQNPLRGILNTPWGVGLGAAAATVLFILIPLFLVSKSITTPNNSTKSQPPTVSTTTPAPEVVAAPPSPTVPVVIPVDPTPPPATTPATSDIAETLLVEVDKPTIKEGVLNSSQPIAFRLTPAAGQQLKTTLIGIPAGATMNVLATSPTGVDTVAKGTVNWQGVITTANEYRIEIVPPTGVATSNYRLEVNLIGSTPTATPMPVAPVVPVAPAPVK